MDAIAATMALEQLMIAYAQAESDGGSVSWDQLDIAFDYANDALPGRYAEIIKELNATD